MSRERKRPPIALATWLAAVSMVCFDLAAAAATVYKSVDADGRVTYSDQPPGSAEAVEVLEYQVQERMPEDVEADMARIEAMRETTDRMAADRREREAQRARLRTEAAAAQAAQAEAYRQQYPDYYYGDGSVTTSSRYEYSGWRGGIYIGNGGWLRPPYGRPPYQRPPLGRPPHGGPGHVRPPFRPGYDAPDKAQPGFSYDYPANVIRRRYSGKAREVFYGR